jgi:hypothetical protein
MTLDEIVSHYIGHYRDHARAEMRFFEIQCNPSAAIQKAALCALPSGKRHPHERRIPRDGQQRWPDFDDVDLPGVRLA